MQGLPVPAPLPSAQWVDDTLLSARDTNACVAIRFGRTADPLCAECDARLSELLIQFRERDVEEEVSLPLSIYTVDIDEVPEFTYMYELYDPFTIMLFHQSQPIVLETRHGPTRRLVELTPHIGTVMREAVRASLELPPGPDAELARAPSPDEGAADDALPPLAAGLDAAQRGFARVSEQIDHQVTDVTGASTSQWIGSSAEFVSGLGAELGLSGSGAWIGGVVDQARDASAGLVEQARDASAGSGAWIGGLVEQARDASADLASKAAEVGKEVGKEVENIAGSVATTARALGAELAKEYAQVKKEQDEEPEEGAEAGAPGARGSSPEASDAESVAALGSGMLP